MTDSKAATEAKEIKAWYTHLLDKVVKEMIEVKAVTGDAVQAAPVWMIPNEILIAKVWGIANESEFVWAISVDKLIADYVAGSLAAGPREVARHFAMKWQMDADRLTNLDHSQASIDMSPERLKAFAGELIRNAEKLYEQVESDEAWDQIQMPAG